MFRIYVVIVLDEVTSRITKQLERQSITSMLLSYRSPHLAYTYHNTHNSTQLDKRYNNDATFVA